MKKCSICGKEEKAQSRGDIVIGRPESFKDMIGACQTCRILVCGGCAIPNIKVYAKPQYADDALKFVAYELQQGRSIGDIMDEVHARFGGAELLVTYQCPKCKGQIGPTVTDTRLARRKGPKQPMPADLQVCPICGVKVKSTNLVRHKSKCEMLQPMRREEKAKRQEEKQKRRQEEEARRKAEGERRAKIQATRKSSGQCVMCGKALGFFQRLLGIDRHGQCTEFKE